MMDYNGAEKGCGSIKTGVMMMVEAFADGADAYLAGGKEFSITRHLYVENYRRACCPNIVGHTPKSPQRIRRYGSCHMSTSKLKSSHWKYLNQRMDYIFEKT